MFKEVLFPLPGLTQIGLGCLFDVEVWAQKIERVCWSWGKRRRDVKLFGNLTSATPWIMRSGVLTKSLEREAVISFRRLTEYRLAYRRSQGCDISSSPSWVAGGLTPSDTQTALSRLPSSVNRSHFLIHFSRSTSISGNVGDLSTVSYLDQLRTWTGGL
jgi:hypothetical protein